MLIRRLRARRGSAAQSPEPGGSSVKYYRDISWFFLLLCVIAVGFTAWWGTQTIRQASTLGYATTQGVVMDSYTTVHRSKNVVTHAAHVQYKYTVGERTHISQRFAYAHDGPEEYDKDWVDAHQSGAAVMVHYDPSNPQKSVLRQGIMWQDPIALSVSLAALFLSGGIVGWFRSKLRNADHAGGLPVVQLDDSRDAVSLTPSTPWAICGPTGGALAFVGTILIGVVAPRSFGVTMGGLACVIVASSLVAVGAYRVAASRRRRVSRLLVIDHAAETLTIPASKSGVPARTFRLEDVHGFEIEKVKSRSGRNIYVHDCVIMTVLEGGAMVRVQVHALGTDTEAASLSSWLAERVGTRGIVEEPRAMAG